MQNCKLFVGTYEDCIGTNVFFEEDEESVPQTDAFSKKTPINLKYVAKQFKIINMQWAKVPEEAREDVSDDYDMKFKEDYESILKKIEEGRKEFAYLSYLLETCFGFFQ